jgi:hypothetical protein
MAGTAFRINPSLDAEALGRIFAQQGRLHIPDFLASEGAEALRDWLIAADAPWHRAISGQDKVFEMTRAQYAAMPGKTRAQLDAAIAHGARDGFQFSFETIRVPDDAAGRSARGSPLDDLAAFLGVPETLAFLRIVTGCTDIDFADAQATCFVPGDFLTRHDDDVAGKGRRAAYVLGLTPGWRIEWGGLLLFHGADGHVDEGYVPHYNGLNLFRVPRTHSVSQITPFAGAPRLSVTGWLRNSRS